MCMGWGGCSTLQHATSDSHPGSLINHKGHIFHSMADQAGKLSGYIKLNEDLLRDRVPQIARKIARNGCLVDLDSVEILSLLELSLKKFI